MDPCCSQASSTAVEHQMLCRKSVSSVTFASTVCLGRSEVVARPCCLHRRMRACSRQASFTDCCCYKGRFGGHQAPALCSEGSLRCSGDQYQPRLPLAVRAVLSTPVTDALDAVDQGPLLGLLMGALPPALTRLLGAHRAGVTM
jgi:hypothetical protein